MKVLNAQFTTNQENENLRQTNLHRIPGHVERIGGSDCFRKKQPTFVSDHVWTVLKAS